MTVTTYEERNDQISRPVGQKRPSARKRMIIMLIAVGIVLFLIFGFGVFRGIMIKKFIATLQNPPQTVATMVAANSGWQPQMQSQGSLIAVQGANLSAQIAGIVDAINFRSGQDVKKGQLLVTLRPNNDQALLQQLQAVAAVDQVTYKRDLALFNAKAISMQTVDTDRANAQSAEAQVRSQQALMQEKLIYAPFTGRIGIRQVDIGQYLAAGTTIASLQQLNPIDVDFYLPQPALATIHPGMKVHLTVDAFPSQSFTGTINALNSAVDTTSRMIEVQASLTNPHELLRPGMFTRVAIDTGAAKQYVTLPQTAIAYNPYGDTVFIVKHGNPPATVQKTDKVVAAKAAKAHQPAPPALYVRQQFVTLGETRGDQVSVLKGVAPGDQIVVAGQLKLHNNTPVVVNNKILPPNNPSPRVPLE
jgi:membrane fusion protein (multidrug efflux system)